ncbi:MAG: hypothetical protein LBJ64_02055 [Deltaproteobacteria bacterium]|jgi:hypothetical protein|nr:hypothetical protein [Deltaproteobacteria bacterium]
MNPRTDARSGEAFGYASDDISGQRLLGSTKFMTPPDACRQRGKSSSSGGSATLLCLLSLILAVSFLACGVKTHPYPEMVTLPVGVENLTQTVDHNGHLWLTWKAPMTNVAGRPLQTLDHFEVWSARYEADSFCQGCPTSPSKADEVHLQSPAPGQSIWPGEYVWQTDLQPGYVYVFRVAGFSSRGAVHPSSWRETKVFMVHPPGRLAGFRASADDLSVRLSWPTPPEDLLVEVQRRQGRDGSYVNLVPARDGQRDLSVAYENDYYYRARLVRLQGESLLPGPWTDEIAVQVQDALPPAPPPFLDAALSPQGIRLSWQDRRESGDVAGFYLYRSVVGSDNFVRLGGLLTGNTYLDVDAPSNQDVRYRLTAVDDSPRANESRPSPEVEVYFAPPEVDQPQEMPVFVDPGI